MCFFQTSKDNESHHGVAAVPTAHRPREADLARHDRRLWIPSDPNPMPNDRSYEPSAIVAGPRQSGPRSAIDLGTTHNSAHATRHRSLDADTSTTRSPGEATPRAHTPDTTALGMTRMFISPPAAMLTTPAISADAIP
jgi:hypothetical protein